MLILVKDGDDYRATTPEGITEDTPGVYIAYPVEAGGGVSLEECVHYTAERCPYCGGRPSEDDWSWNGDLAFLSMRCLDCNQAWREVYGFVGIDEAL